MIVVRVKNRDISAVPLGPVTAGSVGLPVKWYFGPEWDGLAKIAIFRVGASTGQEMAVLNDVCIVPHELLAEANAGENLFIGVYGRSPALDAQGHYTVIMPTVWTFVRISEAPDPHDVDPEPTPGWEAQLQAAADEAVRLSGEALDKVKPFYMHFWIDERGHLRYESMNAHVTFYLENGNLYMTEAVNE